MTLVSCGCTQLGGSPPPVDWADGSRYLFEAGRVRATLYLWWLPLWRLVSPGWASTASRVDGCGEVTAF